MTKSVLIRDEDRQVPDKVRPRSNSLPNTSTPGASHLAPHFSHLARHSWRAALTSRAQIRSDRTARRSTADNVAAE
ncbi:MAG: hypothetical protein L0J79_08715 [Propionibacterium sp.]|nr:hypothetical protein [Propionibacterium sp.]